MLGMLLGCATGSFHCFLFLLFFNEKYFRNRMGRACVRSIWNVSFLQL